jgi:hypothetical protein
MKAVFFFRAESSEDATGNSSANLSILEKSFT